MTTAAPTTVPPTTTPDTDIYIDPVELVVNAPYAVWHYNPPAPVNSGLNQSAEFDPIEITLSISGENAYVGIDSEVVNVTVTIHSSGINIGRIIEVSPVDIVISIRSGLVTLDIAKCNWVKWSKIGKLDFTIDNSNLAGERPLGWRGCVYHLAKLGPN